MKFIDNLIFLVMFYKSLLEFKKNMDNLVFIMQYSVTSFILIVGKPKAFIKSHWVFQSLAIRKCRKHWKEQWLTISMPVLTVPWSILTCLCLWLLPLSFHTINILQDIIFIEPFNQVPWSLPLIIPGFQCVHHSGHFTDQELEAMQVPFHCC